MKTRRQLLGEMMGGQTITNEPASNNSEMSPLVVLERIYEVCNTDNNITSSNRAPDQSEPNNPGKTAPSCSSQPSTSNCEEIIIINDDEMGGNQTHATKRPARSSNTVPCKKQRTRLEVQSNQTCTVHIDLTAVNELSESSGRPIRFNSRPVSTILIEDLEDILPHQSNQNTQLPVSQEDNSNLSNDVVIFDNSIDDIIRDNESVLTKYRNCLNLHNIVNVSPLIQNNPQGRKGIQEAGPLQNSNVLENSTKKQCEQNVTEHSSINYQKSCPICLEILTKDCAATICGHIFCLSCIKLAVAKTRKCPTCRAKLKVSGYHKLYL